MKDITIPAKRLRKEIVIALCCFLFSFVVNIVAVIAYAKPWHEIFSQIGYVVVIAAVIWVIVLIIRIMLKLITKIFRR